MPRPSLKSLTKDNMVSRVNKILNNSILDAHVVAIIQFLVDEIILDMENNKILKISNFGILQTKKLEGRKYHNFRTKKVEQSDGSIKIEFKFFKRIKKFLTSLIDEEKTFNK